MPVVKPCIVGRMGSTTYYETTMTGRELAHTVRPAKETDGWASAGIEERMQREFNMNRIRTSLVPYLAQQKDRFFGSILVLVEGNSLEFEPLEQIITQNLPAAYRDSAERLGFVTINEGEHIALDGQHRLLAFREVITSGENLGEFASQVGEDEVCVLLLEFEDKKKTRRIFNNVNRHAKPTGRSDNIITSEDDGVAIVTRWLLDQDRDAPLASREIDGKDSELVNWTSNTLGQNSRHLTTISTVYETAKSILKLHQFEGFDMAKNPVAPQPDVLDRAYATVAEWWDKILTLDVFANALDDLTAIKEPRFDPTHPHTLLLRPVGQVALVEGLARAIERSDGQLTLTEALRRANRINWSCTPESMWRDTIVRADGRMVARKEARELAADLIAYLIGAEFMTEEQRHGLWDRWSSARGNDLSNDNDPEGLPEPITA